MGSRLPPHRRRPAPTPRRMKNHHRFSTSPTSEQTRGITRTTPKIHRLPRPREHESGSRSARLDAAARRQSRASPQQVHPTGVTADAIHLVSADSRADEPLPCFLCSAGKRVPRPPSRGLGGTIAAPTHELRAGSRLPREPGATKLSTPGPVAAWEQVYRPGSRLSSRCWCRRSVASKASSSPSAVASRAAAVTGCAGSSPRGR